MVFDWMITAVSPRVRDLLSVVIVRVTLQDVSPSAMAMAVAMASARYLMALTSRCFWVSFNGFIVGYRLKVIGYRTPCGLWAIGYGQEVIYLLARRLAEILLISFARCTRHSSPKYITTAPRFGNIQNVTAESYGM